MRGDKFHSPEDEANWWGARLSCGEVDEFHPFVKERNKIREQELGKGRE